MSNIKHTTLGSHLSIPSNMKGYIYIYILFLISVASVCYGSSSCIGKAKGCNNPAYRKRCALECERIWDNGRKKCCEGSGNPNRGAWHKACNNDKFTAGGYGTMQCSDCTEKCRDSSSEESQEINVDVAPPRRQPTTRKPQDMDKYYTKKASGGSKGCPGSLDDCMAACPSNVRAFRACAATCSKRCSKK